MFTPPTPPKSPSAESFHRPSALTAAAVIVGSMASHFQSTRYVHTTSPVLAPCAATDNARHGRVPTFPADLALPDGAAQAEPSGVVSFLSCVSASSPSYHLGMTKEEGGVDGVCVWSVTGRQTRTYRHLWAWIFGFRFKFLFRDISEMRIKNSSEEILELVDRCLAVIPPAEPSLPRENDIQCHIHDLLAQRQSLGLMHLGRTTAVAPRTRDDKNTIFPKHVSPAMVRPRRSTI